jgi:WD40 repeat protein
VRHPKAVRAVAFAPDGKSFLTAGDDGEALRWDAASGRRLGKPLVHEDAVWAAAFSPDGKIVFTGSKDKTAQFWDVATGRRLGPPLRHRRMVQAAAFHPGGEHVLTGGGDGAALWGCPTVIQGDIRRLWLRIQVATGLELKGEATLEILDDAAWLERRRSLE